MAAAPNRVKIKAPHKVKADHSVKVAFTGFARPADALLAVLLDNRKCAKTGAAERNRSEAKYTAFTVSGNFHATLKIQRSVTGTHYVCAYLENSANGHTAARASAHYKTS